MLKLAGPKGTQDKCLSSPGAYPHTEPMLDSRSTQKLELLLALLTLLPYPTLLQLLDFLPQLLIFIQPCHLSHTLSQSLISWPSGWPCTLVHSTGHALSTTFSLSLWTFPEASGWTIPRLYNKNLHPNHASEQPCPCFIQQSDFQLLFPLH